MANNTIIKKFLSISPQIEITIRKIYWRNIRFFIFLSRLNFFNNFKKKKKIIFKKDDLTEILNYLTENGIKKGDTIIVHSSLKGLSQEYIKPSQIIDGFISILGNRGTICMPASPKFKNAINVKDYILIKEDNKVYDYDINRSSTQTGLLPFLLLRRNGSIRSRHPINTMVANGFLAKYICQNNPIGIDSLPCGKHSSWDMCLNKNAWIIGFNLDLTHSLTMIHLAEDKYEESWPIDNWYRNKKFLIKNKDFEELKILRERKPVWGTCHFAERTLCRDLINEKILISSLINGVAVELISSKKLIDYLKSRNSKGYPYY